MQLKTSSNILWRVYCSGLLGLSFSDVVLVIKFMIIVPIWILEQNMVDNATLQEWFT